MIQLLKAGTKWEWTEELNADFNDLKKELTTQPRLAHYNGSKDIWGGYFKNFGDEIPQTPGTSTETFPETANT